MKGERWEREACSGAGVRLLPANKPSTSLTATLDRNIGFLEKKTVSKFVLFKGPREVNLGYFLILGKHLPENTLLPMIRP